MIIYYCAKLHWKLIVVVSNDKNNLLLLTIIIDYCWSCCNNIIFYASFFINTKILLSRLIIDKSISISTLIFFKNFLILILKIHDRFACWWLVKQSSHNFFETKLLILFMFMICLKLIMTLRYFKCINRRCQIFISIVNLKNMKIDIFSTLIE